MPSSLNFSVVVDEQEGIAGRVEVAHLGAHRAAVGHAVDALLDRIDVGEEPVARGRQVHARAEQVAPGRVVVLHRAPANDVDPDAGTDAQARPRPVEAPQHAAPGRRLPPRAHRPVAVLVVHLVVGRREPVIVRVARDQRGGPGVPDDDPVVPRPVPVAAGEVDVRHERGLVGRGERHLVGLQPRLRRQQRGVVLRGAAVIGGGDAAVDRSLGRRFLARRLARRRRLAQRREALLHARHALGIGIQLQVELVLRAGLLGGAALLARDADEFLRLARVVSGRQVERMVEDLDRLVEPSRLEGGTGPGHARRAVGANLGRRGERNRHARRRRHGSRLCCGLRRAGRRRLRDLVRRHRHEDRDRPAVRAAAHAPRHFPLELDRERVSCGDVPDLERGDEVRRGRGAASDTSRPPMSLSSGPVTRNSIASSRPFPGGVWRTYCTVVTKRIAISRVLALGGHLDRVDDLRARRAGSGK